jgi:hypothetical protein
MIDFEDNENNTAMTLMLIEKGYTPEEAVIEFRKMAPIYGLPKDVPKLVGDDKPLPIELKDRINIYNIKRAADAPEEYKNEVKRFSSFNAFIRSEIKKGKV